MIPFIFCQRYYENGNFGLWYKDSHKRITEPIFQDIRRILNTDYYLKVKYKNKWGVISSEGKFILEPNYDDIECYKNAYFRVIINNHKSLVRNPFVKSIVKGGSKKIIYGKKSDFTKVIGPSIHDNKDEYKIDDEVKYIFSD